MKVPIHLSFVTLLFLCLYYSPLALTQTTPAPTTLAPTLAPTTPAPTLAPTQSPTPFDYNFNDTVITPLGQSGKIRVKRGNLPEIIIELDSLKERDSAGNAVGVVGPKDGKHSINTFAPQVFTFSTLVKDQAFGNVTADMFDFTSDLGNPSFGRITVVFYLITSGGVVCTDTECWETLPGDVKWNIKLDNWDYCGCNDGTGEFIDVAIRIQTVSDDSPSQSDDDDDQTLDLGRGATLQLSNRVDIDGTEVSMPNGFPDITTVEEEGETSSVFTFRFPKFMNFGIYDPILNFNESPVPVDLQFCELPSGWVDKSKGNKNGFVYGLGWKGKSCSARSKASGKKSSILLNTEYDNQDYTSSVLINFEKDEKKGGIDQGPQALSFRVQSSEKTNKSIFAKAGYTCLVKTFKFNNRKKLKGKMKVFLLKGKKKIGTSRSINAAANEWYQITATAEGDNLTCEIKDIANNLSESVSKKDSKWVSGGSRIGIKGNTVYINEFTIN